MPDVVIFSKTIWDGLDPQVQRWITEAANDSVTFQRKLWREQTEEATGLRVRHEGEQQRRYRDQAPRDGPDEPGQWPVVAVVLERRERPARELRGRFPALKIIACSGVARSKPYWADAYINKSELVNLEYVLSTV